MIDQKKNMPSTIKEEIMKKQKNHFSKEEDALIVAFVKKYGLKSLKSNVSVIPNRTARQIRERYRLYLDPNVNHNAFSLEEEYHDKIFQQSNRCCFKISIQKTYEKRDFLENNVKFNSDNISNQCSNEANRL
jgi:hypothetical protein